MIDYHIHTLLCNHAEGGLRDYVRAAIEANLSEICFLEHLSLDPHTTSHAMHPNEVPLYLYAVQGLKYAYQDQITIRAGLEIDYSEGAHDAIKAVLDLYEFDFIGGSIHFVDGVNIASRRHAATMDEATFHQLSRRYASQLMEMVESGLFDVACHLDVIKKNGMTPPMDVDETLMAVITRMGETGMALEVNSGGLYHPAQSCYPSDKLIRHAISCGVPLTVGSDSHNPQHVGRGMDVVPQIIARLGGTHITRFENRRPIPTPLTKITTLPGREKP